MLLTDVWLMQGREPGGFHLGERWESWEIEPKAPLLEIYYSAHTKTLMLGIRP